MAAPTLRPLTLPSLSPDLVHLQQLRLRLAQAQERIQGYHALDSKLATFTDEPTWNAYIPLGSLAYFPGQLVHTNDITRVDQPARDAAAEQDAPPRRVLRSAKQARDDAAQAIQDLEAQVVTLTNDIEVAEADLRKKRDDERKLGKGGARTGTADMGDEDWTINAQGEVINEEGLPMFDIREDLPIEPTPVASSSKAAQAPPSNSSARARGYLIKKGGKQVVRPLPPPIPTPSSAPSPSTMPAQPSSTAPPPLAPVSAREHDPNPFPARPPLDVKAILDELEAEEAASAAAATAAAAAPPALEGEADEPVSAPESMIVELPDSPPPPTAAAPPAPSSKAPKPAAPSSSAGGFGGFSAGFLAKSKQKRPSNSLATGSQAARSSPSSFSAIKASTTPSSSASSSPPSNATVSTPAPLAAAAAGLKPALSRPVSPSARSRSATPAGDKKRVAFDLPPPSAAEEHPSTKKAPILLGPPPSSSSVPTPEQPQRQAEPKRVEAPAQRPIRDVVVERPLRKAVPPGGGAGAQGAASGGLPVREKRLSRFKREAFGGPVTAAASAGGDDVVEGKGKGRPDEREVAHSTAAAPPSVAPAARPVEPSSSSSSPPIPSTETMPAPVHTISLSARPSSSTERAPGTVSFGDIPFGSDDEDEAAPHVAGDVDGEEGEDDEDDDWDYSDDDDFDDEELDVDLALHQREVALAYHRQRLMLGAGRGTGPLGGWHAEGENPFGAAASEEADQALVPADATLQSLDPSLAASTFGTYPSAGSAQEGRPSRFRQSNRNLESAQLIIPSLLAADPSLAMSHTPLGPPLEHDGEPVPAGADDEDERLRRTLEALAEGRPLPEDEQAVERAREIELREELARDKASARRDRTAGKRPPEVVQTVVPERKAPVEVKVREKATAATQGGVGVQQVEGQEEEKPKKLSRFRQKQLGLIE